MEIKKMLQEEAWWILETHQLPSGAVVTRYPAGPKIVPYFAHLALYGVLAAGDYGDKVRAYLEWYVAHLERPDRFGLYGTVYDYRIAADGREIPEESYDSSDSYAATFLSLVRRYYEATGDRAWLQAHREELEAVAGAMLATEHKDGLTLARPDWPVKYLMDNCEVYRGLEDYAMLQEEVWGNDDWAGFYRRKASRVVESIRRKMWVGDGFSPLLYAAGLRLRPNWKTWYPDVLAQLFTITCGVLEPGTPRARQIYRSFLRNYPSWHLVPSPTEFTSPLAAWAAALVGDEERLSTYFREVREKVIGAGRPWPWHAAESGVLTVALRLCLQ
ncbi:MAG: hypothetical protein XD51_1350 [Moorella sp. 60_41]|nr:MAG: hypothetical protein XD51_1350 [Moorella sp. 60_41]